jgi:hypothetical protein
MQIFENVDFSAKKRLDNFFAILACTFLGMVLMTCKENRSNDIVLRSKGRKFNMGCYGKNSKVDFLKNG